MRCEHQQPCLDLTRLQTCCILHAVMITAPRDLQHTSCVTSLMGLCVCALVRSMDPRAVDTGSACIVSALSMSEIA